MMSGARLFLVLSVLVLSGCKTFPVKPVCLVGDSGCVCHDARLPKPQQDYTLPFDKCLNYVCTDPDSYIDMRLWVLRHDK